MSVKQKHIIQKVFLEINAPNIEAAHELKSNLNPFLLNSVFPQLEKELNRLGMGLTSGSLRFPKLYLASTIGGPMDLDALKMAITEKIIKAVRQKAANNSSIEAVDSKDTVETLFYFLEEGTLPWWFVGEADKIDFEKIIGKTNYLEGHRQRLAILLKNSQVQERLARQFDTGILLKILIATFPTSTVLDLVQQSFSELGQPGKHDVPAFWQALIISLLSDDLSTLTVFLETRTKNPVDEPVPVPSHKNYWKSVYQKLCPVLMPSHKSQAAMVPNESTKNLLYATTTEVLNKDLQGYTGRGDLYIEHAGLILIHPFLKPFFESNGLIDGQENIKDKDLAVHLLHYLVTKKTGDWEHLMTFEKFLCGVPTSQPIDRKTKISKKLKDEAEDLLRSVLQNWEVLKDASTDLLRNEFLQRPGKICFEGKSPKITVAHKPQDILMSKIPWTIGVCKLPWLNGLIFTDW